MTNELFFLGFVWNFFEKKGKFEGTWNFLILETSLWEGLIKGKRNQGVLGWEMSSMHAFFILTFEKPSCPAVKQAKAGSDKMAGELISDGFNALVK